MQILLIENKLEPLNLIKQVFGDFMDKNLQV